MKTNEPVTLTGLVISNQEMAPGQYLLSCQLPATFPDPAPGQFVMVKTDDRFTPLLRRPFSVYNFYRGDNDATLEFFYRQVGPVTKLLAALSPGANISVVGPLGRAFTIIPERKNIILLAGGIGVAPLSWLATLYVSLFHKRKTGDKPTRRVICYLGAATSDTLAGLERMEACETEVTVCTDDGSCGYHGNVIDRFRCDWAFFNPEDAAIYACGPTGMLKSLAEMIAGRDIFCQVSLEERMACGLGACLGCAVALSGGEGAKVYKRVCKDGPVFNIQDVDWHA